MTPWTDEEYAAYDAWWRENWPEEAARAATLVPVGPAKAWADEVLREEDDRRVRKVVRAIAALCGEDTQTVASDRALANASGIGNRGDMKAATAALVGSGWLRIEVEGRGRGARTTYVLTEGDPSHLPVGRPVRRGGRNLWKFRVVESETA